jgi:perosamine synthetase
MEWKIPLFRISWDENDVRAVDSVIRSGADWAVGDRVTDFEAKISSYTGTTFSVAVNSGTSALHIMLLAHGIGDGDEVIVPSFTFVATANAVRFVGATPIFADIENETFGLDPADVELKITPKTRAIMPVHYAGGCCRIEELRRLAQKKGLLLLEDAAESLGAKVGGTPVGSFGHSAILSFCQNKIISTGEGGAVITKSSEIYNKLILLRSHGRQNNTAYFNTIQNLDYVSLGYNFRMSNIIAALGFSQIGRIDSMISLRRQHASQLRQGLSHIRDIRLPQEPRDHYHVYQMFSVSITGGKTQRDGLQSYLAEHGIMSRVYFEPVHLTRYYRESYNFLPGMLPVTEQVAEGILSLPIFPGMTQAEIDFVISGISAFFEG